MEFLQPATWEDALAAKAERPDAVPIQGGTDVMVELNFDRARPPALLNLNELAELRDPYETSQHAKRVGTYSKELYAAWALRHRVEDRKIKQMQDILLNAAILHDVGKVALSDVILRKPGGLGKDEITQMKSHTIYGARLFKNLQSPWDRMAAEVALNHHERWDGRGYPGKIDNIFAKEIRFGPGKRAKEIPPAARPVVLVCRRSWQSSCGSTL